MLASFKTATNLIWGKNRVFEFKVQDYPAPANDVCEKAHKLIVTDVDAEPLNFADCDLTYATKDLVRTTTPLSLHSVNDAQEPFCSWRA